MIGSSATWPALLHAAWPAAAAAAAICPSDDAVLCYAVLWGPSVDGLEKRGHRNSGKEDFVGHKIWTLCPNDIHRTPGR